MSLLTVVGTGVSWLSDFKIFVWPSLLSSTIQTPSIRVPCALHPTDKTKQVLIELKLWFSGVRSFRKTGFVCLSTSGITLLSLLTVVDLIRTVQSLPKNRLPYRMFLSSLIGPFLQLLNLHLTQNSSFLACTFLDLRPFWYSFTPWDPSLPPSGKKRHLSVTGGLYKEKRN